MEMTRFEKIFVNRVRIGKRNASRVDTCLRELSPGGIHDTLEIGCGIGVVSAHLANINGLRVVATDLDRGQIDAARRLYETNGNPKFQVEDSTRLSFEDNSFDLVIVQNVFHHIANWRDAVKELARVLRSGGLLIWDDFTFPRWLHLPLRVALRSYGLYSPSEVRESFARHGFQFVQDGIHRHGPVRHHQLALRYTGIESAT